MATAEETRLHGLAALPGRIVLVDDNRALRAAFRKALERAGHAVTEADDGRVALELLAQGDFDLVVSDVQMPDMGGVELLKAARERDPDLSVVLISGNPDLDSALRAVEYGAVEYLMKPVVLAKLVQSVDRALEIRRSRVEARHALEARSGERVRPRFLETGEGNNLTGSLLGGKYRVGQLIGSGGMGAVYEGVREDLARMPVAIKVLHPALGAFDDLVSRFRREAHTIAALDHPNIVRTLDFQATPGEPAFLVMERLHGASLGECIARDGLFTLERIAFVGSQILAALEAAHRVGVIHRDLKPDNVFLTELSGLRDIVKLLDFGIAKLTDEGVEDKLTQTGVVLGTPAYMAPEQARGASVDHRSDLYAVGCIMFEALVGKPPFQADNYNALLFEIQQGSAPSLERSRPDLDPEFVVTLKRSMEREPGARFESAAAMNEALLRWVVPQSTRGERPPNSSPPAFAPTLTGQPATTQRSPAPTKRSR